MAASFFGLQPLRFSQASGRSWGVTLTRFAEFTLKSKTR
jgi:hypothetical protein